MYSRKSYDSIDKIGVGVGVDVGVGVGVGVEVGVEVGVGICVGVCVGVGVGVGIGVVDGLSIFIEIYSYDKYDKHIILIIGSERSGVGR